MSVQGHTGHPLLMPRVSEFVQLHALPAFFANGRFARELPFAPALPIRQEIAQERSLVRRVWSENPEEVTSARVEGARVAERAGFLCLGASENPELPGSRLNGLP